MRPTRPVLLALAVGVAALHASCGMDDPTRVGRPPIVRDFSPSDRSLRALVGDTLTFRVRATDPDHSKLRTAFQLDDSVVANAVVWRYVVDDTGTVTVRATVTDGQYASHIEWSLARRKPANYPPIFTALQPVEANPTMIIGHTLTFAVAALDPEGAPLSYYFSINDTLVATTPQLDYVAPSSGVRLVRVVASDGENSTIRDWRLTVTLVPDTIPPELVTLTSVETGVEPGEVALEWIAVGRNGMTGIASQYLVRTAPEPIRSEYDWGRASERPDVPAPLQAGEIMRMSAGGLAPAVTTYLAVRAMDDFGNLSPMGESPVVVTRGMRITGSVLDALTGTPIEGASVVLSSFQAVTGPSGEWAMNELPYMSDFLVARDEQDSAVGGYFDYVLPYWVSHGDDVDLYLLPNQALDTRDYADFLEFFREMTDILGNPNGAEQRRWQLPIELYVQPYSGNGLDYRATIQRVANELDAVLGQPAFRLVDSTPAIGVETTYEEDVAQDYYGVTQWSSDWYQLRARIHFRTVYGATSEGLLERVARHELGHALGLNHSTDPAHVMIGNQVPSAQVFSSDETAILRCRYVLPRGWDNRRFERY